MKSLFSIAVCTALIGTFWLASHSASANEHVRDLGDGRVLLVDFSGKPPFSRRIVAMESLSANQLQKLDSNDVKAASTRAHRGSLSASFRGKPPFRARAVTAEPSADVEFARFEEQSEEESDKPATGAPGKSLPFRRR